MSLFRRRPDIKAMAYMISETSMNRLLFFSEQNDLICYYGYIVSSYIILDVMLIEYTPEIVSKCKAFSHEFFMKKYKQFKGKEEDIQRVYDLFDSYDLVLKSSKMAEYFIECTQCRLSFEEVERLFREWYRVRLLIHEEKVEY